LQTFAAGFGWNNRAREHLLSTEYSTEVRLPDHVQTHLRCRLSCYEQQPLKSSTCLTLTSNPFYPRVAQDETAHTLLLISIERVCADFDIITVLNDAFAAPGETKRVHNMRSRRRRRGHRPARVEPWAPSACNWKVHRENQTGKIEEAENKAKGLTNLIASTTSISSFPWCAFPSMMTFASSCDSVPPFPWFFSSSFLTYLPLPTLLLLLGYGCCSEIGFSERRWMNVLLR
jgi:hypothetical protein